jgi:hypothetical protein
MPVAIPRSAHATARVATMRARLPLVRSRWKVRDAPVGPRQAQPEPEQKG